MSVHRHKLRTKTGCLTCKNRRKKCDEKAPTCGRCALSGRDCQWPTSTELLDRRYASHHQSRHALVTTINQTKEHTAKCKGELWMHRSAIKHLPVPTICHLSETVAHEILAGDLELVASRHFVENYYRLTLLPNCHPDFYFELINEIQDLMLEHKCLHYSVLANAASHIHFIDASVKMQELALTYYSKALRGLSSLLTKVSRQEGHNGILSSVMLLYLHGCMGRGTYADIPNHLAAAIRILKLRFINTATSLTCPFDRLVVESVLYQVFLVTTGLWSDEWLPHEYTFDAKFWRQAEGLLNRSTLFAGQSYIVNSPVIGVPVALYRLAIELKLLYCSESPRDARATERLRNEVKKWEAILLENRKVDGLQPNELADYRLRYYRDASYLFIIVNSLLFDQIASASSYARLGPHERPGTPLMAPKDCWQIRKAVEILKSYRECDEWPSCFIGNWPVYSIGFFVSTTEDAALVSAELDKRFNLMKFAQLARFKIDVGNTWIRRGLVSLGGNKMFGCDNAVAVDVFSGQCSRNISAPVSREAVVQVAPH